MTSCSSCIFSICLVLNVVLCRGDQEIIEIRYLILEEVPIGTFVGNVLLDSNLSFFHPPEVMDRLYFRFFRQPLNPHPSLGQQLQYPTEMFSLESATGVLRTATRVDRDEMCPGLDACQVKLDVAVQPVEHMRILRLSITIKDINDNYPVFPAPQVVFDVMESASVGTSLLLPSATDIDSPRYSVKNYRIVPQSDASLESTSTQKDFEWNHGNGFPRARQEDNHHHHHHHQHRSHHKFPFQLRKTFKPGRENSLEVCLILSKSLDREIVPFYEVVVEASDGDSDGVSVEASEDVPGSSLSATILVRINVIDVNDNAPVFERDSYEVRVREDVSPGSFITTVHAYDKDSGINGKVNYEFSSLTENSYGSDFFLNNTSGDIFNRGRLDFEKVTVYRLTVVAQDKGPDPTPVTVVVSIFVEDVNDNTPEISVDTLSSHFGEAEVVESLAAGTFVAHVSVTDKDSGDNGRFDCTLRVENADPSEPKCFALKTLLDSEYQIVTTRPLDREEKPFYKLQIECRDMPSSPGNDIRVGRTYVEVKIGDVNDNDPEFEKSLYVAEVIENNYVGAVLMQVNAVDRDAGRNAYLEYSLENEEGGVNPSIDSLLNIEASTGVIKALMSFDREVSDKISFVVVAKDGGQTSRSSSVRVIITITDVNDEKPKFEQDTYTFEVAENEPQGTVIGQIIARDADYGSNGEVFYEMEILSGHVYSVHPETYPFVIDKRTGILSILYPLDRELEAFYQIMIKACDGSSSSSHTSSALVDVIVLDRNDNPPQFEDRLFSNKTFQISTASPVGFLVTNVVATDRDEGDNGRVTYTLEPESQWFNVDSEIGAIYVTRTLHDKHGTCHDVTVKASDEGFPPESSYIAIVVCINNSVILEHRMGRSLSSGSFLPYQNLTIVIVLAVVSTVITIALISAIFILRKQDGAQKYNSYNCRKEDLIAAGNRFFDQNTERSRDVNLSQDLIVEKNDINRPRPCNPQNSNRSLTQSNRNDYKVTNHLNEKQALHLHHSYPPPIN